MILAGVDEAGFGPVLGPLVVSGTAWAVPDQLAGADLWEILADGVSRTAGARDLRLPIVDSKKLYSRLAGLAALERTALVMLHLAGRRPRSLRALLQVLAPGTTALLDEYPWYAGFDAGLPRSITATEVGPRANAVKRVMTAAGAALLGVFSEVMPEGHFNRGIDQTRNKAVLLTQVTLRVIQRVLRHAEGQPVHVMVDRQGGRQHYAEPLLTFFEGAALRIVEETDTRSAYDLTGSRGHWTIEFLTRGESRSLPVALASIYSKYMRELLMEGLNHWFARRLEGLTPTAGYYTDAQRFLADVEPVIRAEGIDRHRLIRCR